MSVWRGPSSTRIASLEQEDVARGRQLCRLMLRQVAASIAAVGRGPGQGKLCSLPLLAAERERIDRCLEDADAA